MPSKDQLARLQRQWFDLVSLIDVLATNGVTEITGLQLVEHGGGRALEQLRLPLRRYAAGQLLNDRRAAGLIGLKGLEEDVAHDFFLIAAKVFDAPAEPGDRTVIIRRPILVRLLRSRRLSRQLFLCQPRAAVHAGEARKLRGDVQRVPALRTQPDDHVFHRSHLLS